MIGKVLFLTPVILLGLFMLVSIGGVILTEYRKGEWFGLFFGLMLFSFVSGGILFLLGI